MVGLRSLLDLFSVPRGEPRLAVAQAAALARQVPVLHAILSVDAIAVSYTHYDVAPPWLTIYPLALLLFLCSVRMLVWMRRPRHRVDAAESLRRLQGTNRMAAVLGSAFTLWAVMLSRYGDTALHMHVLFFLTITMIACVFCLMHLRSAARIVALIAFPTTIFFVASGSVVVAATALNFAAVVAVMMFMQAMCYRDFRNLVRQYDDLEHLSDENARLANRDALTGLPNRRSFFARLDATIAEGGPDGGALAIGVIDLDGFKPVNDTFGHAAGDEVLREVARRLESALAGVGWAARLGGDEFGLIIEGGTDVAALGRSVCEALRRPYTLRTGTAQIGASIGFATDPAAGDLPELLVERADYALYYAKAHHRGTAVVYTRDHEASLRRQSIVEQSLRHADLEAELSLMYQPILDTHSGQVVAFEALARWQSPTLGPVSPGDFIPVAERACLIQDVTYVLLRKAVVALRDWPEEICLSFNLSTEDLASSDAVARITSLVAESGIPAHRFIFEVTETALMRDVVDAQRALAELKAIGAAIALDDFGTGYSSLGYVHRLPIDKLKIDRSFITEVCTDRACRDIVKSIVDLCRNLRLACVVEGVETHDQMMVLRGFGCFTMQGYLFHKPMPVAAVAGFLAELALADTALGTAA